MDQVLSSQPSARVSRRAGRVLEPIWHPADNPERGTAPGGSPGTSRTDQRRQPTYPAAQLRHSPARQGSRSPERSGITRTPQPRNHAGLHPCHTGPFAAYISGGASSCSLGLHELFSGRRRVTPRNFSERPLGSTRRIPKLTHALLTADVCFLEP